MSNSTPYKVFMYNEPGAKAEVRRFGIDKELFGKIKCLHSKINEIFPTLKSKLYTLAWQDEEGDSIAMTSDAELQTMLSETTDSVFKLYVTCHGPSNGNEGEGSTAGISNPASAKTDKTPCLHVGILCDVCGCAVVGYRYKCITCDEFDLCVGCERDGKHPEHCVVRVPVPNMPLPLIKASIKKSRKFLKSVASQALEENKRLRRERVTSRKPDANANQGKQDSQPDLSRNWIEIFGKYLEEFTNLAGDVNRQAEKIAESEQAKRTLTAGSSTKSGSITTPNNTEISNNPWNLPLEDLEKLQHACQYMRDNAVRASLKPLTKAFNKVLEIATTVAEEATAQSPAIAFCPKREASVHKTNEDNPREMAQEAVKQVEPEVAKPSQGSSRAEPSKATSGQQTQASDSRALPLTEQQIDENKRLAKEMTSQVMLNRCDIMSDLVNAVAAARSEMASNASSCSSEGQGSDKADGWTVIDDAQMIIDSANANANLEFPSNMHELPESVQERIRSHAPYSVIYPALHSDTAVHDPNEGIASGVASAPVMTDAPKPQPKISTTKAAKAAAEHQTLRSKLAPHVTAAVLQMESMGFCNESGWLTQLLDQHDGNIAVVLDLITPGTPPSRN